MSMQLDNSDGIIKVAEKLKEQAKCITELNTKLEAAKQIIEAVANRLEDEDPSLLALDIKYLINKSDS